MGNNGKTSHNAVLDGEIRDSLKGLERLVRLAGDDRVAGCIQKIIQSPDQMVSLKEAFSAFFRKSTAPDEQAIQRRNFFANFSSAHGALSSRETDTLVSLTKQWCLSTERVEVLKAFAKLWQIHPALFWFNVPDDNSTRRCVEELERTQETDPTRRKVSLVMISQDVENEQKHIRERQPKKKAKPTKQTELDASYARVSDLRAVVDSICSRLYPGISKDERIAKKAQIATNSRWGWKWNRLSPIPLILSLPQVNSSRYERREWKWIEFEAINAFIETLPQFTIITDLRKAWDSIVEFHRSEYASQLQALQELHKSIKSRETLSRPLSDNQTYQPAVLGYLPGISYTVIPRRRKRIEQLGPSTKRSRARHYHTDRPGVHSSSPVVEGHQISNDDYHEVATPPINQPDGQGNGTKKTATADWEIGLEETNQNPDSHPRSSASPTLESISSQGICSLGPYLNADQLQHGPHIDPSGSCLFPSQPQVLPGPHVDPFSSTLFIRQSQLLPGPYDVDPSISSLLPNLSQEPSIPNIDHFTPQSLRLSSPELVSAVGNVIDNIQQRIDREEFY
ncbi:hypothetical protein BDV25DRAFT_161580 [Aspergillus avenaceus]|uniref:Uncharacterized protein n=1 Tax=Aspergillus avenaceus TaxID=36643 RepID=A0A5N6TKN0_ASPAV|nr:hypothetical protein BDV25DRAFT_161580 [Aspergillus avenaceus]